VDSVEQAFDEDSGDDPKDGNYGDNLDDEHGSSSEGDSDLPETEHEQEKYNRVAILEVRGTSCSVIFTKSSQLQVPKWTTASHQSLKKSHTGLGEAVISKGKKAHVGLTLQNMR
jgi:hypothetical protein